MKLIYCLMVLLCPCIVTAQAIKPLTIGDSVPDIALDNIINYTTPTASMADFKGKLLILDFWATWCSGCIKNLPKMEALQRAFEGKLQVLCITGDSEKKVIPFFERYAAGTGSHFSLPTMVNAAEINDFFPHTLIPHYVWISPAGKVLAITSEVPVTSGNIASVLAGKAVNLPVKEDLETFDYNAPLVVQGRGEQGNDIKYRSMITGPIAGAGNITRSIESSSKDKVTRIFAINSSILDLYKMAFDEAGDYPDSRIILKVKDAGKLRFAGEEKEREAWKAGNTFCYELIVPPSPAAAVHKAMAADLARCFGLRAYFINIPMNCRVITSLPALKKAYTKGGEARDNLGETFSWQKYIDGQPVEALISYLNSRSKIYIVNETGCSASLDLQFPDAAPGSPELSRALQKQGLLMTTAKRSVRVLVITDN